MITYMNKQYKLVQFPLYVVLFALFFSCGENDADFTFSDSLKNKYSDAVLGEYETKDTESGKVIYKERVIDQGIISTSHYLILAVECTITGMLIALIIFTEGYKKTIKETFNVELRIGVYLLVVLIIKISYFKVKAFFDM